MDLYIAARADAPHLLKIGRSSNSHSRRAQLQRGHCFRIKILAIVHSKGNCEKHVHIALAECRVDNSEWFAIDLLQALETIEHSQPTTPTKIQHYDLEEIARKNLEAGRTLTSTRYPHLSTA